MGRTCLRIAEQPNRKRNDDIHTALRAIGFDLQAVALMIEDDSCIARFVAEEPTQPQQIRESTSPGVVVAPTRRKASP